MRELEHLAVELAGSNLIEASAGTGKTYAIACLYLRLLVEKGLTPDRILVVTFTEAATEELRGRIRARIREALDVFAGAPTKDSFLQGLAANANGRGPGSDVSIDLLDRAIRSFDTASIFTIHGFCLRALQDNAFESGSLYDTELVADSSDMLQEIVDDFWRMTFFGDQAPLLNAALERGYSPASLAAFAGKMLDNPKMLILPDLSARDREAVDRDCRGAFAQVGRHWASSRGEVVELLENDKGLSRSGDNYRHDVLPALYDGMDAFTGADNPYDLFGGFEKFTVSGIIAGTKPKGAAPAHPFFDTCERLATLVEERFLLLKGELVAFCRERLPLRKREANIRFFSDLLNDLYAALKGGTGDDLADRLRDRYRAALIDEFQDTDPVQYEIFRRIYADADTPLFLIGDPKQAIYSFRGADIFAYLEAARNIADDRRHTLTNNWRSSPLLLDAFNAVFDNAGKPFVFEEISYHRIASGKGAGPNPLNLGGYESAPLQVWTLPAGENGDPLSAGKAVEAVRVSVAAEIARILSDGKEGSASITEQVDGRTVERPAVPGDIAVIVRSHRQAGLVQDALRELGIPSVMRSDESVFATGEAMEICTVLAAVADPLREYKVRAALATSIMGLSGNGIAALLENESEWEACLEKFRDYHQAWRDLGFMAMTRALLARDGVRGRLLRRPDGERRLTNVLHCFELIHQAAHAGRLGVESLITWFSEKVASRKSAEEYQIRLETDEKAVKIVTVHLSKGLEYPIVFCPFLWSGTRADDDVVTFHDGFTMVRDFGSARREENRRRAGREILAEGLRLLYVALTRAKYRCYLVAGKIDGRRAKSPPETSPVSYLFHAPGEIRNDDDPVSRLVPEVRKLSAQRMEEQLREFAGKAPGAITVAPMPAPDRRAADVPVREEGTSLSSREPVAAIDRDWRVASFTSLARGDAVVGELPDRDETTEGASPRELPAGEAPQKKSMFTFPRGVQAGIFLHAIFEALEFCDAGRDKAGEFVARELERFGFDPEWQPHVCDMLDKVLSAPIPGHEGTFSLSSLRQGSWVTELEFFFPLRFITSGLLGKCLREWSGRTDAVDLRQVIAGLGFRPVRGMLRGFMDMVFEHRGRYYLLDWKSNHLGFRAEDYSTDNLAGAMERNLYPLQYYLYTVALNRYLSLRVRDYDYETHFGGVLYVFLRGVNPESAGGTGIFRDIPPVGLVRELTQLLIEADFHGECKHV